MDVAQDACTLIIIIYLFPLIDLVLLFGRQIECIAMGLYRQMKDTFIEEYRARPSVYKERLVRWAAEPPVLRVDKPTNIARARELGYKAKAGILVARVRVIGGTKKRVAPGGGRKPSKSGRFFSRGKSTQAIAEERAAGKFTNCEVLNSYKVGAAGSSLFYEVILVDRSHPAIVADPIYSQVLGQRGRAYRGLTSAGRKHRGIATKGFGTIRFRPSKRSYMRG